MLRIVALVSLYEHSSALSISKIKMETDNTLPSRIEAQYYRTSLRGPPTKKPLNNTNDPDKLAHFSQGLRTLGIPVKEDR